MRVIRRFVALPFPKKKIHGCPLPILVPSSHLLFSSPRWWWWYTVLYFIFLLFRYSCLGPTTDILSFFFFFLSFVRYNPMAAPTPTTLVNRYQTCVYPEAPSLPDDVARRTLFSFFFFFSLRRSLRCFSNDNLCFNDTPARACKQLAEPERRTFFFLLSHTHFLVSPLLFCLFIYLFFFFILYFYVFLFLYFTHHV